MLGAMHGRRGRAATAALVAATAGALISVGSAAGASGALKWKSAGSVPVVSSEGQVTNLSCIPSGFCLAVGVSGQTVAWNGSSWHRAPSIARQVAAISGVSCATKSFCIAIGFSSTMKRTIDYTVTWTGSSWQAPVVLYIDRGEEGEYDRVHGVSCTATDFCMTLGGVGSFVWNGTGWSKRDGATGGTDGNGVLSCASSRFCANIHDNLPNYWNGTAWHWSSYNSESLGNAIPRDEAFISQLSCVSATFCVAVDPLTTPLIWDGYSWLYSSVSRRAALTSVSCTTATFCVATSSGSGVALEWDGASWTPTSPIGLGRLPTVVSCSATRRCVALTDKGASAVTTS